ncbi:hypothetical protein Tco_1038470 [Tanacetum coccineum]
MQEFTDTFIFFLERLNIQRKEEEKLIFEEAARQEEEKRIAKEKEAAEKFRIDPTLSNFTISTKRILLSDFEISPVTPNVETVNSLSMGDKHLDTSKDSLESSVKDLVPIPSESNDTSNGAWNSLLNDGQFQTALNDWCNLAQQNSKLSIYDENNKIRDCYKLSPSAITPDLPITDSLIMEDEHLDTIPVTKSANTIKSSVDDLVPIPSESADLFDGEIKCDVPINDDSSESHFTTFSNPLFDSNDDFSSDDESLSEEEIQKDLDVVIPSPPGIDERCFNAESDLLESLQNREIPIDSTKIDSIFDEFSLPRPPKIPSFSQDEMYLVFDDSIPSGIDDDDDSEGGILFVEPVATMENNIEELNEDESFDPGEVEMLFYQMLKRTIPSH